MRAGLPEPLHPTGRELTELERCLFCLYLVAAEAKRCAEVFLGHEDRKRDSSLVFTVINHAGIIIHKFTEAWDDFNGLAKSDDRVRRLCAAVKPAIAKINEWPGLTIYRNQALAHPYRNRQGRVLHPTAFIRSGAAPQASDEMMYLVLMVIAATTAAVVFFEKDFRGIQPLLENYDPEPDEKNPMTAQQRDAAWKDINGRMNDALAALGVNLANPLFKIFSLGA